ncbi:MAG TPA: glycosyltransferase family 4 protein [Thermoplasmata archaeon]|nr:glycosyltransferase family 4 protein [Thermoplasmata archaeon]
MRIAELCTRFPPGPGGVERHVDALSREFVGLGEQVQVFTSDLLTEFPWERLPPEVRREETVDGFRVHRLPVWSLPGGAHYTFFRGLPRALAKAEPEIVHAHTYGTNQTTAARTYRRRSGTPYVITAHFHPTWSIHGGWFRHRLRGFYDGLLAAPTLREASAIIVQGAEEERLLRVDHPHLPRVVRIPPGRTPLPPPLPEADAFRRHFELPGPFLLFVGRLASNKGLGPLVEAFGRLARTDPNATLVLAGADGGELHRVEDQIRRAGLEGRVRIVGYIADEHLLASGLREARILVLPSEYEAFGLVLLEALYQGTAVLASRVGGIPEVLDDGRAGRLVPPLDAAALSAALIELWQDPEERQRLVRYGQEKVLPRYSWPEVARAVRAVFTEVLGR